MEILNIHRIIVDKLKELPDNAQYIVCAHSIFDYRTWSKGNVSGELHPVDRKILEILQVRGRISNVQLAAEIGLSPSAVLERVRKLEKQGIIERYTALVNNKRVGLGTVAFVAVSLNLHQKDSIENFHRFIQECKKVLECYHIAGVEDYILKVYAHNIDDYEHFLLNELTGTKGIDKIKTMFVLSTLKRETAIPLDLSEEISPW